MRVVDTLRLSSEIDKSQLSIDTRVSKMIVAYLVKCVSNFLVGACVELGEAKETDWLRTKADVIIVMPLNVLSTHYSVTNCGESGLLPCCIERVQAMTVVILSSKQPAPKNMSG
jgi:hypothetical protein